MTAKKKPTTATKKKTTAKKPITKKVEEVVVTNIEEVVEIKQEVVEQIQQAKKVEEVEQVVEQAKEYKVSNEDYQWFLERKNRIQLRDVNEIYERYEKITGKKARKGCSSCKGTFKPLITEIIKIAEEERDV